jgi:hypothetical protein
MPGSYVQGRKQDRQIVTVAVIFLLLVVIVYLLAIVITFRSPTVTGMTSETMTQQSRSMSTIATACTFGLGPDYDGTLTNRSGATYYLRLTCAPDRIILLNFEQYPGPFDPSSHLSWRLIGVTGQWGSVGDVQVFYVRSIGGWVLA